MRLFTRSILSAMLLVSAPQLMRAGTAAPLRFPKQHHTCTCNTKANGQARPDTNATAASPLRIRTVKG